MPSKWMKDLQEKNHNDHMRRIRDMKPTVDDKKPREMPMSGKKEIERKRIHVAIEKGNRLLLDRLGKAMDRKNIDNELYVEPGKFVSLEATKKRIELQRVTAENHRLLHRIQNAEPAYDHNAWEAEAEHREFYLKNMTEFPDMYVPAYLPHKMKYLAEQKDKRRRAYEMRLAERGEVPHERIPVPSGEMLAGMSRPSPTHSSSSAAATTFDSHVLQHQPQQFYSNSGEGEGVREGGGENQEMFALLEERDGGGYSSS